MLSTGVLFALGALLAWGLGDFLIQRSTRAVGTQKTILYNGLIGSLVLLPFIWNELPGLLADRQLLLMMSGLGLVSWFFATTIFYAYKIGKLAIVEPVLGFEVPASALLSLWLVKENVDFATAALIAVTFAGILVLSTHDIKLQKKFILEKGVLLAFFGTMGMALCNVLVGMSSRETSPMLTMFVVNAGLAFFSFAALVARKQSRGYLSDLKKHSRIIASQGVVDNVGWVLFAYAMVYTSIPIAVTISQSYIIISVLLALYVTGEKLKKHQWAAIPVVIASVLALSAMASGPAEVRPAHQSYNLPANFFDQSFSNLPASKLPAGVNIHGLTVNHHLLGARLISESLASAAHLKPHTIVLLSPNHFHTGNGNVISSVYNWQTPYGLLEVDAELVTKLSGAGLVNIDERPFEKEHGVSGLTPFIKKAFPEAKIVTIVLKDMAGIKDSLKLAEALAVTPGILVVGSLDFSHGSTGEVADQRDAVSLAALEAIDPARVGEVAVDSRPALRTLVEYAKLKKADDFYLINNTNSAKILNNFEIKEATSYINGFFISY